VGEAGEANGGDNGDSADEVALSLSKEAGGREDEDELVEEGVEGEGEGGRDEREEAEETGEGNGGEGDEGICESQVRDVIVRDPGWLTGLSHGS